MAKKEEGMFDSVKKQIAATVGIVVTTAGTLVVANMEKIFGTEDVAKFEEKIVKDSIKPAKEPKTIIIKEVPSAKKEEPKKKTETEQRKDEGFDW